MYRLSSKTYCNDINDSSHRLISMFHNHVSEPLQQYILTDFDKSDSVIHILVSTAALEIGTKFTTWSVELHVLHARLMARA